jgi:hypothetical protein
LALVAEHWSSKEIAVRLGISPHTVDQHVRRALHRLGAPTRREAARWLRQTHHRNLTDWRENKKRLQPETGERDKLAGTAQWLAQIRLPISSAKYPSNTMNLWFRLMWIFAIAVSAAGSTLIYLAGLEELASFTR